VRSHAYISAEAMKKRTLPLKNGGIERSTNAMPTKVVPQMMLDGGEGEQNRARGGRCIVQG